MATATARATQRAATGALLEKDLVYVTGKGGAGKTTVAAALGRAAAASGRRTIVCDVTGGGRPAAIRLAENLWSFSVDPHAALIEWMRTQPGGALAAPLLGRSTAFTHFVDAAPGAKELVTIGKVVDLAAGYDLVVVDGPSTGHALGMLAAPQTVARVARVGPIGEQARGVHDFLADPDHTGYVGVTLPEEMSLHELLELETGLEEALGRSLDLVVVDGVYPDRFTNAEAEHLQELARRSPATGQLHEALVEHRRARSHAKRVRWLRTQTQVPVVTLPFVFGAEIGPAEHELLARRLPPD
jgi:anion-transporting  ArsA/GET3 family ATPase